MATSDKENPMKQAGTHARNVSEEVRQQTSEATHSATEQGKSILEQQKHSAAREVGGVANALRQTAKQLDEQDQPSMARIADIAAGALDDWSHTLGDRDVNSLVDQVTDFARRQPIAFLGGAVAAGFVLSRFMKSSSPEHYEESESAYYGYGESAEEQSRHAKSHLDETPELLKPHDTSVEVKGDLL